MLMFKVFAVVLGVFVLSNMIAGFSGKRIPGSSMLAVIGLIGLAFWGGLLPTQHSAANPTYTTVDEYAEPLPQSDFGRPEPNMSEEQRAELRASAPPLEARYYTKAPQYDGVPLPHECTWKEREFIDYYPDPFGGNLHMYAFYPKEGETLTNIAWACDTTVEALFATNRTITDEHERLPASLPVAIHPDPPPKDPSSYVRGGGTLSTQEN